MDEFVQGGVKEAVVCPGSRSTPLAMLALAHQDINVHVLVDERSAAFMRLVLQKQVKHRCCLFVHQVRQLLTFTQPL